MSMLENLKTLTVQAGVLPIYIAIGIFITMLTLGNELKDSIYAGTAIGVILTAIHCMLRWMVRKKK